MFQNSPNFYSIKSIVALNALPHLQLMVNTSQHDGVHAKRQRAINARIGTIALQHVANFRAADGSERVNVGNWAARARFD